MWAVLAGIARALLAGLTIHTEARAAGFAPELTRGKTLKAASGQTG